MSNWIVCSRKGLVLVVVGFVCLGLSCSQNQVEKNAKEAAAGRQVPKDEEEAEENKQRMMSAAGGKDRVQELPDCEEAEDLNKLRKLNEIPNHIWWPTLEKVPCYTIKVSLLLQLEKEIDSLPESSLNKFNSQHHNIYSIVFPLTMKGVTGGRTYLSQDQTTKQLTLFSKFHTPFQLSEKQLDELKRKTLNDWEGFGHSKVPSRFSAISKEFKFHIREVLEEKKVVVEQSSETELGWVAIPSPFFDAIRADNLPRVSQLIKERPDEINSVDLNGFSVVHQAFLSKGRNNREMVKLLIRHGADPTYAPLRHRDVVDEVARDGDFELLTLLVEHGVDVNHKGLFGQTPLNNVAACRYRDEVRKCFDFLISQKCDVNPVSDEGMSPLMVVNIYDLTLAEELFKHGANPLLKNSLDQTGSQMARARAEELKRKIESDVSKPFKEAAAFDLQYYLKKAEMLERMEAEYRARQK